MTQGQLADGFGEAGLTSDDAVATTKRLSDLIFEAFKPASVGLENGE